MLLVAWDVAPLRLLWQVVEDFTVNHVYLLVEFVEVFYQYCYGTISNELCQLVMHLSDKYRLWRKNNEL